MHVENSKMITAVGVQSVKTVLQIGFLHVYSGQQWKCSLVPRRSHPSFYLAAVEIKAGVGRRLRDKSWGGKEAAR